MEDQEQLNKAIMEVFSAPHLRINKKIMFLYGLDVAIWIADVFSRWNYFLKENKLDEDGFFFISQKKIRESTHLNFNKQSDIIKTLEADKIIEVNRKGLPRRNWYKINIIGLINKIGKNTQLNQSSLYYKDQATYDKKDINNKEDNKKESSKEDKASPISNKYLPLSIFNKRVQGIFAHWQSLSNTTKHNKPSKTRNEALKDLDYYVKKYNPKTIKQAMNVYNTLLDNLFIMMFKKAPFKIGLNEFFGFKFNKASAKKYTNHKVSDIKSWFDICMLGTEEAERIMTKISKDDNPKVTKKLKKEFDSRIEKIKNPEPRDENAFISTSRYIIEFLKVNNKYLRIDAVEKRNPVLFVPYLYDYLAENNNGNKQHPGWFTNDYFYDNFPVWMVKKGHMTESRKVKRR